MQRNVLLAAFICLAVAGCSNSSDRETGEASSDLPATEDSNGQSKLGAAAIGNDESRSGSRDGDGSPSQAESNPTPVAIRTGTVALSPENTKIQFVGKHRDLRPDRTGVFEKFQGEIKVDPSTKAIDSIAVEIEAASLVTGIVRLTNHLKSADFFEVDEFPMAKFQSTDISAADAEGQYQVTGTLDLHGVEKNVTFSASATFTEAGLIFQSEFILDRSDFDMNWGPDQVKNEISMTIVVGEKTQRPQAQGPRGGGGRGRRGARGAG